MVRYLVFCCKIGPRLPINNNSVRVLFSVSTVVIAPVSLRTFEPERGNSLMLNNY